MKKIVLAALTAAVLTAACSPPPPPPPPAPPEPPPKVLLTITAKSPEAVTAVNAALDLMANVRATEATAELQKALVADADCALANALLGSLTPGSAGMEQLTKAETLAATASPAEKAYVLSLAADRRGEDQIALDALKTATTAAADDWRMHFALGQAYFGNADLDNAGAEFTTASGLNPSAGAVHNMIGYLSMRQGKPDEAIAAFTKYTELSPTEANAQDSLAEALMAAGKLDEAEAGFQKALALDPAFFPAWSGIAQARFLKGDWTGGREALAKERETSTRDQDKVAADMSLAWSYLAEGKAADAMKTIDGIETMAKDKSLDVTHAFAPLNRAEMLTLSGKAAKALPLCDEAATRAAATTLPGGPLGNLTRMSLITQLEAYAALGKAKEAAETLAKFEAEIAKVASTPDRVSQLAYARGTSAMAAKDYKAAAEQFATCGPDDLMAKLHHARALKLSGDEAGSGSAARALLAVQHRDPAWLWIAGEAKKLAPVAAPAGT